MTAEPVDDWTVEAVDATDTHELRRFVLRRGTPTDNVNFETDRLPETRHLAIRDAGGRVIATSTWSIQESPGHPGVPGVQLRAMAVHDDFQGRGLGSLLVAAGVGYARDLAVELVWANARDTALGFYASQGFGVVGDGFLTTDTQIPHHLVVRIL